MASEVEIRDELKALGDLRKAQRKADKKVTKDIKAALRKAKRAGVTKSEAARLLGVHRTTLYRVYE